MNSIPMDRKLLAILAIFFLINIAPPLIGSIPVISDSTIYLYQAKLVSGGLIPYKDFFLAHPPLMLLPAALLFSIFGFSFKLGAIQPIAGGILVLTFTYLLGERIRKNTGLLASFILLASPYLNYTSHWLVGISLSLGLAMAAVWAHQDRPKLSALLSTLALITRYSIFPIPLALAIYSLYKKEYRYFSGLLLASPLFLILFLIPNFAQNTILYHTGGGAQFGVGLGGGVEFLTREFLGVALGALGIIFLRKKAPQLPLLIISLSPLVAFLFRTDLRPWYLLFTIPFLCIIGSAFLLGLKQKKIVLGILLIPFLISFIQIGGQFTISEADSFEQLTSLSINAGEKVFDTSLSFGTYYALTHNAEISGGIADFVPKRFLNNAVDPTETISKLKADPPQYIFDFHTGALPQKPAADSFWRNSELGDYIHDNYSPTLLTTLTSTKGEQFLVLVWEKGTSKPDMQGSGDVLYKTNFLTYYDLRTRQATYGQGLRKSTAQDILPSESLVENFKSLNVLGLPALVPGTWADGKATQGALTSKSWATGNTIFTETTSNGQVTSITRLNYSPDVKTWDELEIYQNLYGNFVLVYREQAT